MDAVTGSWSGVEVMFGLVLSVYQCHIRASAGRDGMVSVGLDAMISPGVCAALPPDTHLDTMAYGLVSL